MAFALDVCVLPRSFVELGGCNANGRRSQSSKLKRSRRYEGTSGITSHRRLGTVIPLNLAAPRATSKPHPELPPDHRRRCKHRADHAQCSHNARCRPRASSTGRHQLAPSSEVLHVGSSRGVPCIPRDGLRRSSMLRLLAVCTELGGSLWQRVRGVVEIYRGAQAD